MEEENGNGSALRIRPEPSTLSTVAPGLPEAAPFLSLGWSPVLAQPKKEAEDVVSLPSGRRGHHETL